MNQSCPLGKLNLKSVLVVNCLNCLPQFINLYHAWRASVKSIRCGARIAVISWPTVGTCLWTTLQQFVNFAIAHVQIVIMYSIVLTFKLNGCLERHKTPLFPTKPIDKTTVHLTNAFGTLPTASLNWSYTKNIGQTWNGVWLRKPTIREFSPKVYAEATTGANANCVGNNTQAVV